jgi:hypothetical protein
MKQRLFDLQKLKPKKIITKTPAVAEAMARQAKIRKHEN